MKKWVLITGGILIGLIIIGIVALNIYKNSYTQAQLTYDAQKSLTGLNGTATVRFDKYAVPHISAESDADLYYAAGYITASERMWQMEVNRLAGQGRLAEFMGPEALDYDKLLRTIGFHRLSNQLSEYIDPNTLEKVQHYVDGVNAYIEQASANDNLPLEYTLLDFEPEPWTLEHSLAIIRLMGWELNKAWHLDIVMGSLIEELGERKVQDIFPNYPEEAPEIMRSGSARFADQMLPVMNTDLNLRKYLGMPGTHVGSNSWVISGDLSVTGKPILANDPHLGFTQPSKFYEIHLKGPGINVAGVALPGAPGVVIGHNEHIAWGLTNVMADDADFYLEQIDEDNPYLYFYRGQWTGMDSRVERITVRGLGIDSITVRETHRGPIISDIHPLGEYTDRAISMEWTGHEMSDELTAIDQINRATNWDEFSDAVETFHVPGQNIIYADTAGNIGYRPAVKLPNRRRGEGSYPVPGDVNSYDWTGFIEPSDLPYLYNPPEDYIANANNEMIDDSRYRYHVSNLYEPPSRINRILELLNARESHSVKNFQEYQADYISPHARKVSAYFVRAFEETDIEDRYVQEAVNWLDRWDYSMDTESIPASIFNVSFNRLIHNLYKDEMGDTLLYHFVKTAATPVLSTSWLLEHPLNLWWDNVLSEGFESRDVILRKSLIDAVDWLRENYGRSMVNWQWGMMHQVTFPHLIGQGSRLAEIVMDLNVGPFEVGGAGTTINNGEFSYQAPYENILGPATRKIVDLSNTDNALSVIYSGQSGHPTSPHYKDQTKLWLNGEYHTLPLSDEGVERITRRVLVLQPEE